MKHLGIIQTAACAALLFAAVGPRAVRADEWDKKTIITFSDAVQVPGANLPAGKYVFKLAESSANRYVVQIFNERENHVFATLIAIPNYRMTIPDKTVINFYEAPAGQPEPIKAWFYPGDNFGRQFVYKKSEAALIAKTAKEEVPTDETTTVAQSNTTQETTSQLTQSSAVEQEKTAEATSPVVESQAPVPTPAPVAAEPEPQPQPQAQPVPTNDQPTTASSVTADQQPTPAAVAAATPDTTTLPSTASELPMVGLIGLLSIAAAAAIRTARRAS